MSEPILFEDTFTITNVNSAKYERVARVSATNNAITTTAPATSAANNATDGDDGESSSHQNQIALTLDVNTELYPLNINDRVQVALALTLNADGSKDDGDDGGLARRGGGWRDVAAGDRRTLADEYDYVCHGKIYRFEEGSGDDIRVFVSFGGLLLYLEGPYAKLHPLRIDHVYLLMKK